MGTFATVTEEEREQVARANLSGRQPVLFVHGLWLLPSSWERWASLFEEATPTAADPDRRSEISAVVAPLMRSGRAEIAVGATQLEAGDQVLAILEPGKEDELRRVLLRR